MVTPGVGKGWALKPGGDWKELAGGRAMPVFPGGGLENPGEKFPFCIDGAPPVAPGLTGGTPLLKPLLNPLLKPLGRA